MLTELPANIADLVRSGRDPGSFALMLDGQAATDAMLRCAVVVRALPGKRLVYRGEWQGRAVFIKLYLGGKKHWHAELQGLQALHAAGIAAPAVVFSGSADEGAVHVILLEPIQPARSLEAAWHQAPDDAGRNQLLEMAVATIARHHAAGLEQQDIHLDNFLLSGEELFTLDGGGIRRTGRTGLPPGRSLDNLALFFAQLYPSHDHLVDGVLASYTRTRGVDFPVVGKLHRRIRHFRHRRQKKFMKKVFRDCSAFVCKRGLRSYRVYDRAMETPQMIEFLSDPDASLQQADVQYLKQGNTCTVWMTRVDQRILVVKRYNIKGFLHRISRAFRGSRAAASWKNAHLLGMCGVPVPRPVALLEERLGPLRGRAWYVSEYVQGEDAMVLCKPGTAQEPGTLAAGAALVAMLNMLALSRISHGDMKGTNFILTEQGATMIDLDAMQQHACSYRFRRQQQRDLRRFMRNWDNCPDVADMFAGLIHQQVAGQ